MSCDKFPSATFEGIQVCCISLSKNDRIRLIGLPADVTNEIRNAIIGSWDPIVREGDYYGSYEFKLKGDPWCGHGEQAVDSRRLLAAVLKTMAQFGWNLLQSTDISKKIDDTDTMFFEKGIPDPDADLFALSFNLDDRIRIIDAPSMNVCVEDALSSQWPNGIKHKRDYNGAIEFQLSGRPWTATGSQTVQSRMLLCQLLANVRAKGYKLYGTVHISTGGEGRDLDSWVFRRVGVAWQ